MTDAATALVHEDPPTASRPRSGSIRSLDNAAIRLVGAFYHEN